MLTDAVNGMQSNYAKVHVCSYEDKNKCDLQLEPGKSIYNKKKYAFLLK